MRLPPPGSPPLDIVRYIDALVWESASDMRRRTWEDELDRAMQLRESQHHPHDVALDAYGFPYSGGIKTNDSGRIRFTLNRISRIIQSIMVIQAADEPSIQFVPREVDEEPQYWANLPGPDGQSAWQVIDAAAASVLQQQYAAQQIMDAQAGQTTSSPPPVIEVNNESRCQAMQDVFDVMWDDAGMGFTFRENVDHKATYGAQPTLYQYNPVTKRHELQNCPPFHVFYQRNIADMRRNPYGIYDEYVSADDALARAAEMLAPDVFAVERDAIERFWREGIPQVPGSQPYRRSAMFDQTFRRSGGYIRHAWLQNQPYPMTIEEAIRAKKVAQVQIPAAPAGPAVGSMAVPAQQNGPVASASSAGPASLGDQDVTASAGTSNPASNPLLGPGATPDGPREGPQWDAAVDQMAVAAQPDAPQRDLDQYIVPEAAPVPMRQAYQLTSTGEEVTPPDEKGNQTHPHWPMTLAIRQITIIGNTLVEDQRSPFNRVPLPLNVHVPVPFSPLGHGEPWLLEDLQMALNQIFGDMLSWAAYNSVPPEFILKSIVDALGPEFRKARTKWNQRIPVPDDCLEAVGGDISKVSYFQNPPPLPPDFHKIMSLLIQMMDEQGQQAQVSQGNAAPGWSGEAIQSLQNAHANLVRASGLRTEDWLLHIVDLMENTITNLMSPQDCADICPKYPLPVWMSMHGGFAELHRFIKIEIKSAGGAAKNAETQNLIQARQTGVGVSNRTILQRLDLDPDQEFQNNVADQRKLAQMMPQQPQPANNQKGGQDQERAA